MTWVLIPLRILPSLSPHKRVRSLPRDFKVPARGSAISPVLGFTFKSSEW